MSKNHKQNFYTKYNVHILVQFQNEAVSKAYFITSGLFFEWGKNTATFLNPLSSLTITRHLSCRAYAVYIGFQMINMYLTRNFNLKKLTLRKYFPSFRNLKPHLHYENHSMSSMLLNVFILKWGWRGFVILAAQNLKLLFLKN